MDAAFRIHLTRGWRSSTDWYWLALLLAVVTLSWCAVYNRWTLQSWKTPVVYGGDAWAEMATAKAFASDQVAPIVPRFPASLGAPFRANWNDYPLVEQGVFVWWSLFIRLFGIFPGSNLALLSAHLLAAGSFYFVCRALGYREVISVAGSVLFGMSHYAFARGLSHMILTFYWHIPLGLLVAWLCMASPPVTASLMKKTFCVAVAILHGLQNPYYTAMFLQFLVAASLISLFRFEKSRRFLFPLFLAVVVIGTFALMNVATVFYRFNNGTNLAAVTRNYAGLELYALKPVELVLPFPHRVLWLEGWARRTYFTQAYFLGEVGSPYLGFIGVFALVLLILLSLRALVRAKVTDTPPHFWYVLWIIIFSVVGGVNGFIGLFGLSPFRGTNRYSIYILVLALLFLVHYLTLVTRKWNTLTLSLLAFPIVLFGLWDQTPRRPSKTQIAKIYEQILSDGRVVSSLEAKLQPQAMIFELPIWDFPEVPPVRGMADYEHFRPYLQSTSLRFSYGSDKGRTRERWQREAELFGTENLVKTLETYGFSAILINKKAYEDHAASLLADFRSVGRTNILAESSDLVSVALWPLSNAQIPPEFDENWYTIEGNADENWRWSRGNAKIMLYNPQTVQKPVHLIFRVGSLQPRRLDLYQGSQKIYSTYIEASDVSKACDVPVMLLPGANQILFQTDRLGQLPGNGDTRNLAFNLRGFKVIE